MEGVAFQQSLNGQICALYRPKPCDGNIRVLGAGRGESTVFSQMRRYCCLIETNHQQKELLKK